MSKRVEGVKKHFEQEAGIFDARVVKIVPRYAEMLEALVDSIPFPAGKPIRVADLGCGTGTVSLLVKKRFPNARITCVDMSENMLRAAAEKLRGCKHVSFVPAELTALKLVGKFDAVVSSLALHHVEGGRKLKLFRSIRGMLAPGGVFVNADIFLSPDAATQKMYLDKWASFILKSFSKAQVNHNYRRYKREDRPAVIASEFAGLAKAGFKRPELIWKYYNFAVYRCF